MGQSLPNPVTSVPIERKGGQHFKVGVAEMNGWRMNMEDSHVIHMGHQRGFFGVFDGHGGDECSRFVARRLHEEMETKGVPPNDDAMRDLSFAIDKEFLDAEKPSGTTGTFVIVELPEVESGRRRLRVGNVGDSRVLLGKTDGQIVRGPGSDGAMTTDHKPSEPGEFERIIRTGGTVQNIRGVARVNGDLAVSRAFGDRNYKQTGGPGQGDHPVTAEPEFFTTECDTTDFLLLVCDGISEGAFPNKEVVELAAEVLKQTNDPGAAAAAVCRRALDRKSSDNLTCMIVLLNGGEISPEKEFVAGQFLDCLSNNRFKEVYAAMALRAGLSLAGIVENRYDVARKILTAREENRTIDPLEGWLWHRDSDSPRTAEDDIKLLKEEITFFGTGPPEHLAVGDPVRTDWFEDWIQQVSTSETFDSAGDPLAASLLNSISGGLDEPPTPSPSGSRGTVDFGSAMLVDEPQMHPPDSLSGRMQETLPQRQEVNAASVESRLRDIRTSMYELSLLSTIRDVRVADLETLRAAVASHPALSWHEKLEEAGGVIAAVVEDEPKDGTSLVRFAAPLSFEAWLPTSSCEDSVGFQGRQVRVASAESVKLAIEANQQLIWQDKIADVCSSNGTVVTEDNGDGTTCVLFGPPHDIRAWLPTESLSDVTM